MMNHLKYSARSAVLRSSLFGRTAAARTAVVAARLLPQRFASTSTSSSSSLIFARKQAARQFVQQRNLSTSPSALNAAVASNDLSEAKKLVAAGADVNLGDYDNRTPLHVAASFNNVDMVRWLISEGATLREDRDHRLPIHDAIQYGNPELQQLLLSCVYEHERDFSDTFNPELVRAIFEHVARDGLFSVSSLDSKLRYFVGDLGMGEDYFNSFPVEEIAEHFHTFTAACIAARTSRNPENICVESAGENDMVIVFTDCNKFSVQEKAEKYMMATPKGMGVTLRYMRSKQAAIAGAEQTLNVYHVQRR